MIKYVGMTVLLCALAGCGGVEEISPDEQQDEVSDDAMSQERKQPMLIRGDGEAGGAVRCVHAVEPPAARFGRFLAERPCRFSSRGRRSADGSAVVREMRIEAFRFGFSPGVMTVKKGERVRLLVTSRDVLHGVLLREYRINVTVRRGEIRKIEFVAGTPGEFVIRCPVYCGQGHSQMTARLIVEE